MTSRLIVDVVHCLNPWRPWRRGGSEAVSGHFVFLFVLLLCAGGQPAAAQPYPNRPVRMLVGFPPGGPNDLTARLAAQYLSDAFGQQLVVDNRPGAGGTLAFTLLTQ